VGPLSRFKRFFSVDIDSVDSSSLILMAVILTLCLVVFTFLSAAANTANQQQSTAMEVVADRP
jgi:hypothetical protein